MLNPRKSTLLMVPSINKPRKKLKSSKKGYGNWIPSVLLSDHSLMSKTNSKAQTKTVWYDLNEPVNDIEDNTDVVKKTESEKRLNSLCLIFCFVLLMVASAFTYICIKVLKPIQVIHYQYNFDQERTGVPHVMLITKSGEMVPYTWRSKKHLRNNHTFPKINKRDHDREIDKYRIEVYWDLFNVLLFPDSKALYAIYQDGRQNMIRIDKNGTFRQLPKSKFPTTNFQHGEMVQFDSYIWTLGGIDQYALKDETKTIKSTFMWSKKKQKWIDGPKMPPHFHIMKDGCAVAMNRTYVIFIGGYKFLNEASSEGLGNTDDSTISINSYVMGFDFQTSMWNELPSMPLVSDTIISFLEFNHFTSCMIKFDKSAGKSIMAMSLSSYYLKNEWAELPDAHLSIFNMTNHSWNVKGKWRIGLGHLVNLQGIPHYFVTAKPKVIGYYWDPAQSEFLPFEENHKNETPSQSDLQASFPPPVCYL